MGFRAPKLIVHFVVIDDIVAVLASGRGLQIRRAIDMRNAELVEIIREAGGIVEAEIRVQLKPVRRNRNSLHLS